MPYYQAHNDLASSQRIFLEHPRALRTENLVAKFKCFVTLLHPFFQHGKQAHYNRMH